MSRTGTEKDVQLLRHIRVWKKTSKSYYGQRPHKQGGAVEACWAHNPEVNGSKPFPATIKLFFILAFFEFYKISFSVRSPVFQTFS